MVDVIPHEVLNQMVGAQLNLALITGGSPTADSATMDGAALLNGAPE
jgi:hypothetical protein